MKKSGFAVTLAGILLFTTCALTQPAGQNADPDASVRINQIQVIGTHNSYHAGLLPGIAKLMQQKYPEAFATLDYKHADLATQFDYGIRQIELDIYADSKGGRYAHPVGQTMVQQASLPTDPWPYADGMMQKPGFKVMHLQDIDYVSTCQPFVACLQMVREWSKAHPNHVPIFILIETKLDIPSKEIPFTVPEPFTAATFDALDAEIRSVFPANEMIVPDQVRGKHRTLEEAIRSDGWPTLAQARGKVIFLMQVERIGPIYLKGHPGLRGRVLFTNAAPGHPDAAFVDENAGDAATITSLVSQGYLVRAQADSDTVEARANDSSRRERALSSGTQIVSTDYPQFEPARWSGYTVTLPHGLPARCNPLIAPASCVDSMLEPVWVH
jgi:hypothetical protein